MSVNKKLLEQRTIPPAKKKANGSPNGQFLTFHPTEAEKIQLQTMPPTVEASWDALFKLTQQNVSLTVGFRQENGAYFITLRDKAVDWTEDTPLSAWHTDVNKAAQALCFALETRWADYPYTKARRGDNLTDEW
jgi:hypothetical protein